MSTAEVSPEAVRLDGPLSRVRAALARGLLGAADQPILPVISLFSLVLLAYMDIAAAQVLGPDVRDTFRISDGAVSAIGGLAGFVAVMAALPLAYFGDRFSRVDLTVILALLLGVASLVSGLTPINLLWLFVIARMLTGVGEVSNGPIHQSMLADFHPPKVRPRAFGLHRAGYPLGLIFGSYLAGALGHAYGWRVAFAALAFPAFILAFGAGFMSDPIRGRFEGLAGNVGSVPAFGVAFQRLWKIATLRRVWIGAFFTSGSVPLVSTLIGLYLDRVYHLDSGQRGLVGTVTGVGLLVGLLAGGAMSLRLHRRTIRGQVFYAGAAIVASGTCVLCAALTHRGAFGIPAFYSTVFLFMSQFFGGLYYPSLYQVLALVSPPRVRATGLAGGAVFLGLGALVYSLAAGHIADKNGLPAALVLIAAGIIVGGFIIASAMATAFADAVSAAQVSELTRRRIAQRSTTAMPLLELSRVEFDYHGTRVLFGATLEVREGECLALLGTNGAGKSTLLKVVAGLETPSRGAVLFEGADITGHAPEALARQGLVLVPGGRSVFQGLTVRENLALATWIYRREGSASRKAVSDALGRFPVLARRADQPAAVLSGGERQMLGLAQGLMCRPRLLMIDELTLGLSPLVVEQLATVIQGLKEEGLTMILVEQSVNIASLLCERAYFLDKGRVRFEGAPQALLDRPDLVRSIFLGGAASVRARG